MSKIESMRETYVHEQACKVENEINWWWKVAAANKVLILWRNELMTAKRVDQTKFVKAEFEIRWVI